MKHFLPKSCFHLQNARKIYGMKKRRSGRLAADHVKDGDIIYIDTGTTCHNLVDYISEKRCTIITNSLQVSLKGPAV